MAYKIVQTTERNRHVLSGVPNEWESNSSLRWPRYNAEKLVRTIGSHPEEDWITMKCTVKRRGVKNFAQCQVIINDMVGRSDTETDVDEEFRRPNHHVMPTNTTTNPYEKLLQDCLMESEEGNESNNINIDSPAPVPESTIRAEEINRNDDTEVTMTPQNSEVTNAKHILDSALESVIVLPDTAVPNNENEKYNSVIESLNVVQQSMCTLAQNQETILVKLNEVGTVMEEFMKRYSNQRLVIEEIGFEPINSKTALKNFEEKLQDPLIREEFKRRLSTICGVGKGRGKNNAYALSDVMFTRPFLNECSWAGGSRSEKQKLCFKSFNDTINFFFTLINHSDRTFTMLECEEFFKEILRNSNKRSQAKFERKSATKTRSRPLKKTSSKEASTLEAGPSIPKTSKSDSGSVLDQ